MAMQRYQWPGFKMQLLAGLQRQQNQTQFCDTLLQTEGISVPAHSCILAALSPYLSRTLSASPPPLPGQKHQLKLQAVKAQTLLKLVGLLYSGKLEVTGGMEQNDVLSAVHQLGITELVEGHGDRGMKEGEPQQRDFQSCKDKEEEEEEGRGRNERRTKRDAGVQSDTAEDGAADSVSEKTSSVSTGTQTDPTGFNPPSQTQASYQEPASFLQQCTMQTQKISLDQHISSSSVPPISSIPSGTSGDKTPALNGWSDSVTNPMSSSASSSDVMAVSFSLNNDSNSLAPHGYGTHQLSSEEESNGRLVDSRENGENWSPHGHSVGKMKYYTGAKLRGMAKMKQMQQIVEATQIPIKVKLRRKTKEEVWEVVNLQDKDETMAVLTSTQPDDSNQKRPQSDPSNDVSPPSSTQPGSVSLLKTSLPRSEPATPHSSTTSDSQVPSCVSFTPNQREGLQSVLLSQPQGPVEDTDEQIEKMLEDIMMGLNILPTLETSSKTSHHPQLSNDQASTSCQIQHTENDGVQGEAHAGVGAAGYGCYQDFGTQIGLSSTDTGQIQPSCLSLSSVQLDVLQQQQQQQQQQCLLQYQSSITPIGQSGELSHQGMMTRSKSQTPNHEVATTSAFNSHVHKLHHSEHKDQDQNVLEFLPLANRNQAQSSHSSSLPCMDELQLPPCLSPLESSDSTSQHHPVLSDSTDRRAETRPQPFRQGPSWLTETPESLQFPFSAMTPKDNQSGPLLQDKRRGCRKKQPQKGLKLIPHSGGTRAVSCNVKEKRTVSPHVADRESNIKEDVKSKQSDTKADVRKRKRKYTSRLPEPDGSLPCKEFKVSDGKESWLNLSACSVSLSSNNVLAKERELANISPCKLVRFTGKPNGPSTISKSQEGKVRRPLLRVRTLRNRSFVIRAEETPNNPKVEQTSAFTSLSTPRRRRGRPRKKKLEIQESSSAVTEQNGNTVKGGEHINNNVSKDEEGEKKTQRKGRKRKRNRVEVEVDPPKTTSSAESTGTTETDVNQNMNPAGKKPRQPGTVTLKAFQKLIKQQHFKTRNSKESQDKETNNKQTSRNTEGEGKAEDSIPPDNTEGVNKSPSMVRGTVDLNHNQTVNESASELSESQRGDRRSCAAEEVSLFDTEQCSVFSFSDLGEEVEKLAAGREEPLRNVLQAQACDRAELDTTPPHDDPNQPQEDTIHVDHSLDPRRTVQPLMEAVGCNKLSGCAQREMDEEEEEEVDILLSSPDRVPQTIDWKNGLENVDVSPEEDEDEEVKEIDVTGDDTD